MINPWLNFMDKYKELPKKDANSERNNNLNKLKGTVQKVEKVQDTKIKLNFDSSKVKCNSINFILANYTKVYNINAKRPICNASFLYKDGELYVIGRETNYSFARLNDSCRNEVTKIANTYSDEILYKFNVENNSVEFFKYLSKSDKSLGWKYIGNEDIRVHKLKDKYNLMYTKVTSEHDFYMHQSNLSGDLSLVNESKYNTGKKVEKNWQPIEDKNLCIYSYKPFKFINILDKKFYAKEENNQAVNFRGSSPIVRFGDYYIGLVHTVGSDQYGKSYYHYFVKYDLNLNIVSISNSFKFIGSRIEFNTSIINYNDKLRVIFSCYDNLAYWVELNSELVDKIFSNKLNNGWLDFDKLHQKLFRDSLKNNNVFNAICMSTFTKDKHILKHAIELINNNFTKYDVFNKIKTYITSLLNKYNNCTGCKACELLCPTNAIKMEKDEFGFNYPKIDTKLCINCGTCSKKCPANNVSEVKYVGGYVAKSKDDSVRLASSSGGIFTELANYVLNKKGVVFGAVFDENFNVIMKYTETDISEMRGSKYVDPDIKDTYVECKEFLDNGRLVLYTGTPCQIYGLKSYLGKNYNNLITMDVVCHGVPSSTVWKNYIKSLGKKIKSINFRNKSDSWEEYRIRIEFMDGSVLSENFKENYYMNIFLGNKTMKTNCYECKLRTHQVSDFSIGDSWGIDSYHKSFNDHKGSSNVIIHTEKANKIFNELNVDKLSANKDWLLRLCVNKAKIPSIRATWLRHQTKPTYAIITYPPVNNIGGILQAYALQTIVKKLKPEATTEIIHEPKEKLPKFILEHLNFSHEGFTDKYTGMIVGSDQIWNRRFLGGYPFEDKYLIRDVPSKIVYATSFGDSINRYSKTELARIQSSLKGVRFISSREIVGSKLIKEWFKAESVPVLDPTMLFDKDFYLETINETECTETNGIFKYVLDKNVELDKFALQVSKATNEKFLSYDGTTENFLSNFNKAKLIITDSFHGSVFSLIFNKPFITLRNINRGNDRFDDLAERFNLYDRFVTELSLDMNLINTAPNVIEKIHEYRESSLEFLTNALSM